MNEEKIIAYMANNLIELAKKANYRLNLNKVQDELKFKSFKMKKHQRLAIKKAIKNLVSDLILDLNLYLKDKSLRNRLISKMHIINNAVIDGMFKLKYSDTIFVYKINVAFELFLIEYDKVLNILTKESKYQKIEKNQNTDSLKNNAFNENLVEKEDDNFDCYDPEKEFWSARGSDDLDKIGF